MKFRFQILTVLFIIGISLNIVHAQTEDSSLAKVPERVISNSVPIVSVQDSITPTVSIKGVQKELNSIDLLKSQLEMELSNLNTELSGEELDYRVARILKVKIEETEADLLFIGKMDKIKKIIAYETVDNSQDYIKTAERFLDTLYNDDTEVSENFKSSTKERFL